MPFSYYSSQSSLRYYVILILIGLITFSIFFHFDPKLKANSFWELSSLILVIFTLVSFILNHTLKVNELLPSSIALILCWIPIYVVVGNLLYKFETTFIYFLPLGIIFYTIKYFFNEILGITIYFVTLLCVSISLNLHASWLYLNTFTGLFILFLPIDKNLIFKSLGSIILLTLVSDLLLISLKLSVNFPNFSFQSFFVLFLIQSSLLLLAIIIIPILQKIFSFTASNRLLELGHLDNYLLKQLAKKAPGTYQHSIQVSYLAEIAAQKIQVNSLLCRVGGLYHDIGKLKNPDYFNENMKSVDLYDNQTLHRSASIIIKHVQDGINLGRQHQLPEVIIDFIRTHHGTTKVEFFYRKYKASQTECTINDDDFTYPGPKPSTKEQSIVMLADTVEAACRSLKNPTENELFGLIDKLIENKIKLGQLKESKLSFEELNLCKVVFKDYIKTFYHQRISYPEPISSGKEFL